MFLFFHQLHVSDTNIKSCNDEHFNKSLVYLKKEKTTKKPESKYYKNDALSLDEIDHQYAEVNPNKAKKIKDASKQGEKKYIKSSYFEVL